MQARTDEETSPDEAAELATRIDWVPFAKNQLDLISRVNAGVCIGCVGVVAATIKHAGSLEVVDDEVRRLQKKIDIRWGNTFQG
jgi:hypothetical protein